MKKTLLAIAVVATVSTFRADACTSLIAAKGATTEGGTMVTYAADSHVLYGELYQRPGGEHLRGTMRPIIDWDTNAYRGEIPEAPITYSRIGNMNEKGVTIAESTWGGRPELEGSGLIDYGSLIYIALERSATAREALKVMTDLVDKFGYASEGESFSIADPNEVWIMEMIGKGKDDKGAVWVARRVPDGHISGHANHSRIHQFPLNDPETLYSPDVIDFARKKGYFKGKDKDFSFSRAYAITDQGALRGCDARVWSYYNKFMPKGEADQWLPWILNAEGPVMPLWVKPEKPLSSNDLKWMMRDHFEGTPFDMLNDIGAGPFDVPYRWRPMTFKVDSVEYTHERAIATQQTGFSFVSSMSNERPEAMRGILWFGVDDANTCVYIPVFNSTTAVPDPLGPGDILDFDFGSLFWVNNLVANQAYNRYSQMIPDIRAVQGDLEGQMEQTVERIRPTVAAMTPEEASTFLTDLTDTFANMTLAKYQKLGQFLFVKFLDGNIKQVSPDGKFARTPEGTCAKPEWGGYNERYFRSIANDAGDRLRVVQPTGHE